MLPTRSGPKQRKRFKISNQWDSRRFFSPGTLVAWREDIGRKLGVDEIAAELLPEDKLEYVGRLIREGQNVVMVGDGVNDAPALMKATVGVAMGAGTDVARESANVVLIGNDLSKLVETLIIARRCHRTIMQNFVGTLVVDSIGVGLAAFRFRIRSSLRSYTFLPK